MRRFLTFALALLAGLFVLGVPSAVAGGPTSVLLANYETGRSAAALNGSAEYTELQAVLGTESPPPGTTPPAAVTASEAAVRLVWLIHDVSPWRIDTVHLVGSDVWVETYVNTEGTDPFAGTPTWHQPDRGDDLVASLTGLGVLGTVASGTGGSRRREGRDTGCRDRAGVDPLDVRRALAARRDPGPGGRHRGDGPGLAVQPSRPPARPDSAR